MKKIITILVVMLAFGFSANAQKKEAKPATQAVAQQKEDIKQLAMKDVEALGKVIKFTGTQKDDFLGLFEYKHRELANNLSADRKASLSKVIEAKIKASLSPEELAKLEKNPAVLKKLTN